jgi:hypothetical protein
MYEVGKGVGKDLVEAENCSTWVPKVAVRSWFDRMRRSGGLTLTLPLTLTLTVRSWFDRIRRSGDIERGYVKARRWFTLAAQEAEEKRSKLQLLLRMRCCR